ncbi:MAG: ABC transporter permease [Acidobacteriota bacterium]
MRALLQDLRFGVRVLMGRPGFTAVAVLTLALGIAANVGIFSVINKALLNPLPYPDLDRLVVFWETNSQLGRDHDGVSPANYLDLKGQLNGLESSAAFFETAMTLTGTEGAEQVAAAQVSVDFFKVFRTPAALGRVFTGAEVSGATFNTGRYLSGDRVVIISDGLWRRRFGADQSVVGKMMTINHQEWEVRGVMPSSFATPHKMVDIWLPWNIAQSYGPQRFPDGPPRDWRFLHTVARLKDGLSLDDARAQASLVFASLERDHPKTNEGWQVRTIALYDEVVGGSRPALLMLFGAVSMVLLLACANVAGLTLARAHARQREVAIRAALGATRSRVIRQFLTESLLLSLVGGALGLTFVWLGLDLIISFAPPDIPRIEEVTIDGRVLLFTAAASLFSGVAFAIIPAIKGSQVDVANGLKQGSARGASSAQHRLGSALVVSEIAIALVLLAGAALFARSFSRVVGVDPGFDPGNLLTMHITLDGTVYGTRAADYYRQLIDRLEALPSVASASAVTTLPMSSVGVDFQRPYWREGERDEGAKVAVRMATPGYFRTLGITLLKGRLFNDDDKSESPAVLIVDESLASKVWPNEDAIGKRLMLDYNRGKYAYEVVGVTRGIRYYGLRNAPGSEVFIPHAQNAYLPMNVVVRTKVSPELLIEAVKKEIRVLDPTQPVHHFATMEQLIGKSVAADRFSMWLLGLLSAIAAALAATGIFSLMSYLAGRRTHEIGIRLALGARRNDIFAMIIGRGAWLTLAGIGIGLVASLAMTRLISGLLFGASGSGLPTLLSMSGLLAATTLLACYIPAWRATRVDPMVALRQDL